jgi:undecaprenyl-diphosphatase
MIHPLRRAHRAIAALLALLLPLIDSARGGRVALQLVALGSVNLVLYAALKFSTRRARPFQQCEGIEARIHAVDRYSFPSGHTLHAVAFAALLAVWYPLLAPLLALFAALVGLSRVALGVHYPSDVLAGALIGLCSTATLLWLAAPVG